MNHHFSERLLWNRVAIGFKKFVLLNSCYCPPPWISVKLYFDEAWWSTVFCCNSRQSMMTATKRLKWLLQFSTGPREHSRPKYGIPFTYINFRVSWGITRAYPLPLRAQIWKLDSSAFSLIRCWGIKFQLFHTNELPNEFCENALLSKILREPLDREKFSYLFSLLTRMALQFPYNGMSTCESHNSLI